MIERLARQFAARSLVLGRDIGTGAADYRQGARASTGLALVVHDEVYLAGEIYIAGNARTLNRGKIARVALARDGCTPGRSRGGPTRFSIRITGHTSGAQLEIRK
jgi:hypothetical protein